ncbi:hypothetical protein GRS96_01770 [Rathayibacter sp. VKM Ac-2803]|uniref:hypothetical protein n=1 Tax=unclassified Rathayibacter TaxID=2609250 RepID=UPI00135CF160|nr:MULTISPECIES: hypothetical protein [unclassified Rathayibacter]MWV48000.1 hypothetical protein [Rathayibacter sp. VKM Ac-2803]MWV58775.1 hypothetical protein [Rathayibacter sp. VKM Ac-2754]
MRSGATGIGLSVAFAVLAITLNLVLDRVLGLPMLPRWGIVIVVVMLASVAVARLLRRRARARE